MQTNVLILKTNVSGWLISIKLLIGDDFLFFQFSFLNYGTSM